MCTPHHSSSFTTGESFHFRPKCHSETTLTDCLTAWLPAWLPEDSGCGLRVFCRGGGETCHFLFLWFFWSDTGWINTPVLLCFHVVLCLKNSFSAVNCLCRNILTQFSVPPVQWSKLPHERDIVLSAWMHRLSVRSRLSGLLISKYHLHHCSSTAQGVDQYSLCNLGSSRSCEDWLVLDCSY